MTTNEDARAGRYAGVDLLRGLAAFVVVLIHTPSVPEDVVVSFLFNVLPPANAVFAVLAGFFMFESLRHPTDGGVWFKARLKRLISPYLFWCVFYVLANSLLDILMSQPMNLLSSDGRAWLKILFCGAGATHLWFIPTLFYSQCALFVCWMGGRNFLSRQAFEFGMGVVSLVILYFYTTMSDVCYLRKLAFMFGFLCLGGWFVLGGPWFETRRRLTICAALLILVGAEFLRIGGRYFSPSVFTIVRALSWVALGRAIYWAAPPRWVSTVGSRSMGIYLIHIVFTVSLPRLLQVTGFKLTGSSQTLGIAVCAFLLSFFMAERLRRLHVPGM